MTILDTSIGDDNARVHPNREHVKSIAQIHESRWSLDEKVLSGKRSESDWP